MEKHLGSSFVWFGRERKSQKGASGSGGVGILCRKSVGQCSMVKCSINFEILWVKIVRGGDVYFVGAVYIPPSRSKREDAKDVILELETDLISFRKSGKVILMGDFNCRIGDTHSVILLNGNQFSFPRVSEDSATSGDAKRGAHLVRYRFWW